MAIFVRNLFLSLAAVASVASFVPAAVFAQTTTAQVIVVTQTIYGTNPMSGTVTVTGTGPSLTSTPTSNTTLSFSAGFTGDSRVVTMVPGSYSVVSSTFSNQSVSYSSDCTGYLSAGQSRTCTITSNVGQSGNARVNVSVQVINNNGGNRTAGDFTVAVSGSNVNVPTFTGTTGTTQVTLGNGGYSIDIQNPGSYSVSRSTDCSGTINSGDTRSCLLTLTQYGSGYTNGAIYYVNGTTCYYATVYPIGSTCYNGNTYNNNPSNVNVYYVNGSTCYYGTTYYNGNNCYSGNGVYYVNGSTCYYGTNYAVGTNCYNGGYNNTGYNYPIANGPLTCAPSSQTVDNGQTASFTAYGASGPFTWTVGGRTFFAIGPQLNTVLPSTGTQTVQVSNGVQTASCTVTVTNKQYVPGVILGAATAIPGLPNTGYEPSTIGFALALLGALVAFPLAILMAYPYAKKTSLTLFR
jgi:hypothetical protein